MDIDDDRPCLPVGFEYEYRFAEYEYDILFPALSELRESGTAALRLVTLGAAITWAGATLAVWSMLGFGWRLSLLLGAILIVTGPTVSTCTS